MQTADLETLVPGLAEARAAEQRNRARAFSGLTHTLCGVELLPIMPLHRLRLQLLRNAFVAAVEPLEGDVFVFLWILSPKWEASGLRAAWRQWRLRRRVKRIALTPAINAVRAYIASQLQDMPGASASAGDDYSAYIHWMGAEAGFWLDSHGGFTLESYLRTPYLVLQQLFRAWQVSHPVMHRNDKGEIEVEPPLFLNASDALVAAWHRRHRDAIAEHIRNQKGERN